MKTSLYKIAGCVVALAMTACTGDYEDINSHPFQPGSLEADNYALASAMYNVCGRVIPSDVNMTQFTECLLGCTVGGYFADGNPNFSANQIAAFNNNNGWTHVFMEANNNSIIPTIYTNLAVIEANCERSGNMLPAHIAHLVKVAAMDRVTDCYGPIPYSNIGYNGVILTPYDSQEQIYDRFFEEIDEAIAGLKECIENQNPRNPLIDDVYQSDPAKWIKFANSLKLRLALRISYAKPALAKQMAEAAVNPANGGVIESNADNATYKHYVGGGNPIYNATIGYSNDSRPSADIVCYMNGYNDPRRAAYFTTSVWKADDGSYLTDGQGVSTEYCGVRRGWATLTRADVDKFSALNIKSTDPSLWLCAAEVAFLRAEGAAVFGWSMGGSAEQFYNRGIELSFEQYGVSGAADYIADATSVPAKYYDPSNTNPYNQEISSITIKWDDSATTEEKQERIIVQKWIANMYLGNEAWADKRRTGYPKLIPPAVNNSGGTVDSQKGAQRMPYPQEEYTNNGANVQQAVAEYLGGPDNMGTALWWACKPGM